MRSLYSPLAWLACGTMRLLWVLMFAGLFSTAGLAQNWWEAPNFSVSPSVIERGQCYTISVPNWRYLTLSLGYTTEWSGQQYTYWWPSLDYNGNAFICTDEYTVAGTYTFNYAMNNWQGVWQPVSASVTVLAPPPAAPQPSSLSFSSSEGYAGNDCYTMTVGNGANMTVDLEFSINGAGQPVAGVAMNGSGQWPYCLNHYDGTGVYRFTAIKNRLRSDWVGINPVTYTVRPPHPASFSVTPPYLVKGQTYTMTVGNGANVTLDVQYTFNDGPVQTIFGWPGLAALSSGSPDGRASIITDSTTAAGKYIFTAVRNTLNAAWLTAPSPLTVCPNAPPSVSSVTPAIGPPGSTVTVTFAGANLCNIALSTAWPGLTFSNVTWNNAFSSLTAAIAIAANAPLGAPSIQLNAPGAGSATTSLFSIGNQTPVLSREYIYLGGKVVAIESP